MGPLALRPPWDMKRRTELTPSEPAAMGRGPGRPSGGSGGSDLVRSAALDALRETQEVAGAGEPQHSCSRPPTLPGSSLAQPLGLLSEMWASVQRPARVLLGLVGVSRDGTEHTRGAAPGT